MRVDAMRDVSEWEAINDLAGGFEDACLREVWASSPDWVARDHSMASDEPSIVTVLVQSQFADTRPVLLRFFGVRQLAMNLQSEAAPLEVERLKSPAWSDERPAWRIRCLTLDLVAEGCQAQQSSESFLGRGPFLLAPMLVE